jgi:DNA polymerase-3 subunit epsilon
VTTLVMDLAAAAALVESSEDYRLLRRFRPRTRYGDGVGAFCGLYVDVETTGLDTEKDEIIELGMVLFSYDADGVVQVVDEGVNWLEEPKRPIPEAVQLLTGITPAMVAGRRIDDTAALDLIDMADLIIAHNADFDRRMLERRFRACIQKRFACSYREVDWKRFGCVGSKLQHILGDACREFFSAHRALDDCRAGVHVLASATCEGRTAMSYLLESAGRPTYRVWAIGAPFPAKDELKARGYRWSDGANGRTKAWYIDLSEHPDDEVRWLSLSFNVRARVSEISAVDRYSVRADR